MTVYIEYAFLQNFLLDGVLLWLALKATKTPVKAGKLLLAALFGAVFAVVYPLLKLSASLGGVLKFSVGFLLCMLAFGRLKTKREWGRYGVFSALFFALSFAFGGALLGVAQGQTLRKMKSAWTPLGFALFTAVSLFLIAKLYKKRAVWRRIYACKIFYAQKCVFAQGFLDSGNLAEKNGVPVCFLSPETAYELWGDALLFGEKERGQVCDEMQITTMTGAKKIPLYKGELEIQADGKIRRIEEVYFAPNANMISREYTMILHSRILD